MEHDDASKADVEVRDGEMELRFSLGSNPADRPRVALAAPPHALLPNDRLTLRLRSDRPMRLSVQLRTGADGTREERWQRSVYVDAVERDVTVVFDDMRSVGATRSERPPLADRPSVILVVDTTNTRAGSTGVLSIRAGRARPGSRDEPGREPMIGTVRRGLQPIFRRAPRLRSWSMAAVDSAARSILWPFRLDRPRSDAAVAASLETRSDELNEAAETYYAAHADAVQLLDKPFSEPDALARRLIDIGVLIDAMRLRPGDTVLDLGAGTCWLSHLLNRYGCRTIAVDVSPSALAIGREVFDARSADELESRPSVPSLRRPEVAD